MKYFAMQMVLLFIIISNINLHAQWIQTNGPYGGDIGCFAVIGTKLYAGTEGNDLFLTTDMGVSWNRVNLGIDDHNSSNIYSLAISGSNIYAGMDGIILISTNSGLNWSIRVIGAGNSQVN